MKLLFIIFRFLRTLLYSQFNVGKYQILKHYGFIPPQYQVFFSGILPTELRLQEATLVNCSSLDPDCILPWLNTRP